MKTIIVGSLNKSAGKTSVIAGLARASGKKIGYMKPLGDRLLYKKKRLWDYDSAIITNAFGLEENPEDMSIGFEHAKLKFMLDRDGTKRKLNEMAGHTGKGKDVLFVEGPADLACGISIWLDAITVASDLGGRLVIVVSGGEEQIVDQISYFKKRVDSSGANLAGFIINKVKDVEDFYEMPLAGLKEEGINVLGVVPYREELARFTVDFISGVLFARVVAGERGLRKEVGRVFVGAMSGDAVSKLPDFVKERNKLVITSGDRSDMHLAALETGASAIVISNNILPSPRILARADELAVPVLLVAADTFRAAKQIDDMEPLLTKDAPEKIELLGNLIKEHVDIGFLE